MSPPEDFTSLATIPLRTAFPLGSERSIPVTMPVTSQRDFSRTKRSPRTRPVMFVGFGPRTTTLPTNFSSSSPPRKMRTPMEAKKGRRLLQRSATGRTKGGPGISWARRDGHPRPHRDVPRKREEASALQGEAGTSRGGAGSRELLPRRRRLPRPTRRPGGGSWWCLDYGRPHRPLDRGPRGRDPVRHSDPRGPEEDGREDSIAARGRAPQALRRRAGHDFRERPLVRFCPWALRQRRGMESGRGCHPCSPTAYGLSSWRWDSTSSSSTPFGASTTSL